MRDGRNKCNKPGERGTVKLEVREVVKRSDTDLNLVRVPALELGLRANEP